MLCKYCVDTFSWGDLSILISGSEHDPDAIAYHQGCVIRHLQDLEKRLSALEEMPHNKWSKS